MSSGVNRIYVNSYLAYKDDTGESLQSFQVDFPTSIQNPKALYVKSLSLALTYTHPNISPTQNTLNIDAAGTPITIAMPTANRYVGASNPYGSPGLDYQTELNKAWNTARSSVENPFVFDDGDLKFNFDLSATGLAYVRFLSTSSFVRRLGIGKSQLDVALTAPIIYFDNSPIVARTQALYLSCGAITDSMNNAFSGNKTNIMTQIPLTSSAFGDLIEYNPPFSPPISSTGGFSSLTFQIYDEEFNPISFQSNTNMAIELEVEYPQEQHEEMNAVRFPVGFRR
jgi:hypothetical protein